MRLVRFHLEPWQKGHSSVESSLCSTPQPNVVQKSNHVQTIFLLPQQLRRQRAPDDTSLSSRSSANDETIMRKRKQLSEKSHRIIALRRKNRYPQVVKRLQTLCIDFIANNVILSIAEHIELYLI